MISRSNLPAYAYVLLVGGGLAMAQVRSNWAAGAPSATLSEAAVGFAALGILGVVTAFALVNLAMSDVRPTPRWGLVALGGPVLAATLAVPLGGHRSPRLLALGLWLFWFSAAGVALVVVRLAAPRFSSRAVSSDRPESE